jgi:hypothetical protein
VVAEDVAVVVAARQAVKAAVAKERRAGAAHGNGLRPIPKRTRGHSTDTVSP